MFAWHYHFFLKHSSLNPTFAVDTDVTLENEVLSDSLASPLDTQLTKKILFSICGTRIKFAGTSSDIKYRINFPFWPCNSPSIPSVFPANNSDDSDVSLFRGSLEISMKE